MEFIAWIYPASSTILAAFYIPQILVVVKAKSRLEDVSLLSWGMWALCLMVSFLYSGFVAHDAKIAFFNLLSAVLSLIVFSITAYKRFFSYTRLMAKSELPSSNPEEILIKGS